MDLTAIIMSGYKEFEMDILVAQRLLLPSSLHIPHEQWATWPLIFLDLYATFSISDDLNCFFVYLIQPWY